ncbi:MAG: LamG domain-containing protein [Myxococcota bacterium]
MPRVQHRSWFVLTTLAAIACADVAGLERVSLRPAGDGGGGTSTMAGSTGTSVGAGGTGGMGTTTTTVATTSAGGGGGGGGGASACAYRQEILADAPLAYWRLGETSSAIAADETGSYPGAYLDVPTLGVPGAISCSPDTAVMLDGNDQFIDFGDHLAFTGTSAFSVEALIRPAVIDGQDRYIVSRRTPSNPELIGWGLFIGPTGINFRRFFGGGQRDAAFFDPQLGSSPNFVHVVGTYDGATMRLYVEGSLVDTIASSTSIPAASASLLIGRPHPTALEDHYAGDVDEVAIYGAALPLERVVAHHQARMSGGR